MEVDVREDAVGYVAVKQCKECGGELDTHILGSSSKYLEWSEEQLLEQFPA